MNEKIALLTSKLGKNTSLTEKIDVMNELSYEIRHREPEYAKALCLKANKLSQSEEYAPNNYLYGMARSLRTLGWLDYQQGDFGASLSKSIEARKLFVSLGDKVGQLSCGFAISGSQYQLGDLTEALEIQLENLQITEDLGVDAGKASLLNNIGILYSQLELFSEAIIYFKHSLSFASNHNDDERAIRSQISLATVYNMVGDYDVALEGAHESLKRSRDMGIVASELSSMDTLGQIYMNLKKFDQAEECFDRVITMSAQTGMKGHELESLINKGEMLIKKSDNASATRCLEAALKLGGELKSKTMLIKCCHLLADIHKSKGDFQLALEYFQRYQVIKDEVRGLKIQNKLSILRVSYDIENDKKEMEIAHLKNVALQGEIDERKNAEQKLSQTVQELKLALAQVKQLSGLLPICANCKNIRDENGDWQLIEQYVHTRSEAEFSHGICPPCIEKLYPELELK